MPETAVPAPATLSPKTDLTTPRLTEWDRRQEKLAKDADHTVWFYTIIAAMLLGLVGIIFYSITGIDFVAAKSAGTAKSAAIPVGFFSVFSCSVLIALAATLGGAFLGFIFGIPKTVAGGSAGTTTTTGTTATTTTYQGNTNLEQISDWLTKILVGAGLVELKQIFTSFQTFGSSFNGGALGPRGWIAAPALVIAYSTCGFLLAYLWARIYMTAELEQRADAALNRAAVAVHVAALSDGSSPPPAATPAESPEAEGTVPAPAAEGAVDNSSRVAAQGAEEATDPAAAAAGGAP
ncbi:MAG TPA: hypothetical protein VHR45_09215 [Thermoanaerobaculia bacterium]|nr:hypothetical protein [Thermoanaerobaculia bacterium]